MINNNKYKFFILMIILQVMLLFSVSNLVLAQESGDSIGVGAFLNLPVGTRAIAMGGAFTSIADDPSTIFYNPAGLVSLDFPYLSFNAGTKFYGYYLGHLSFVLPPGEEGLFGLGFGVKGLSYLDKLYSYDAGGNPINGNGSNIDNYMLSPYISIGIRQSLVDAGGGIGFSLKGILSNIDGIKGHGVGLDFGVLSNLAAFGFGICLQDIITIIKYDNRDYIEFVAPKAIISLSYKNIDLEDNRANLAISVEIKKPLLNDNYSILIGGFFRIWKYKKSPENSNNEIDIDDIIDNIEEDEKNKKFGTNLYILAGYDFNALSLGLSFTFEPINLKLDLATQFPTEQGEYFSLFTTLEFHF
ncbi:MAG: hypothetical protein ACOCV8_01075 [Spirochaetota bacterium]